MTPALLVIDVQESFRARPDWQNMHDQGIADTVARLVAAARTGGHQVIWVLHAEPGTGTVFDPALGHVRPIAGLEPAAAEPVLVKTSINAFTTTDLQQRLADAGVDEVFVCGIRTEQCCETTARLAHDLGLDVSFILDATTTSGIPGLGAEQIIERTGRVLAERGFAEITTAERAGALLAASGALVAD